ncbi:MAG: hypothetical protein IPK98_09660 [Chloracidobacterium sp.]|nr:hypothetical protein [Chloracidobacterium sp.]
MSTTNAFQRASPLPRIIWIKPTRANMPVSSIATKGGRADALRAIMFVQGGLGHQ